MTKSFIKKFICV
uniref:Uncharacterized protein n=1 Tax=Vitis vinifera TaxID=29760 RepID=F6GY48_VITVI